MTNSATPPRSASVADDVAKNYALLAMLGGEERVAAAGDRDGGRAGMEEKRKCKVLEASNFESMLQFKVLEASKFESMLQFVTQTKSAKGIAAGQSLTSFMMKHKARELLKLSESASSLESLLRTSLPKKHSLARLAFLPS